nr:hypothetical protein [Streptomyces mutabilis]
MIRRAADDGSRLVRATFGGRPVARAGRQPRGAVGRVAAQLGHHQLGTAVAVQVGEGHRRAEARSLARAGEGAAFEDPGALAGQSVRAARREQHLLGARFGVRVPSRRPGRRVRVSVTVHVPGVQGDEAGVLVLGLLAGHARRVAVDRRPALARPRFRPVHHRHRAAARVAAPGAEDQVAAAVAVHVTDGRRRRVGEVRSVGLGETVRAALEVADRPWRLGPSGVRRPGVVDGHQLVGAVAVEVPGDEVDVVRGVDVPRGPARGRDGGRLRRGAVPLERPLEQPLPGAQPETGSVCPSPSKSPAASCSSRIGSMSQET